MMNDPDAAAEKASSKTSATMTERRRRLRELAWLFSKLGTVAFGGPAAHIAMMEDEVVTRRQWMTRQQLLDLLGATHLIPGPNSTELAIHIGYARAGWRGLVVAGMCFILPAMAIVLALAIAYVQTQATPQSDWLLYGVKPVMIAIVVQALWRLGRSAAHNVPTSVAGGMVIILAFIGVHELLLLFGAGVAVMLVTNRRRLGGGQGIVALLPFLSPWMSLSSGVMSTTPITLFKLFGFFLKVGSILYGSGYVLLAFLQRDLVERWQWLTSSQLLDAIAIGQVTPGPVFTTATFIGYLLAGLPGALIATVGIFLPAFVFVAAVHPWVSRLRQSPWAGGFLDGVNVASMGLMAVVTWKLAQAALVDGVTVALALLSGIAVFRLKINTAWLILAAGAIGILVHTMG